jgi:hypothetical protein
MCKDKAFDTYMLKTIPGVPPHPHLPTSDVTWRRVAPFGGINDVPCIRNVSNETLRLDVSRHI